MTRCYGARKEQGLPSLQLRTVTLQAGSRSLLFLCLGDLVVVYKSAKWEGNRPHAGLRKGLPGCISEQPCLADHLSSLSGGSRSHHTSHTSQDTTENADLDGLGWSPLNCGPHFFWSSSKAPAQNPGFIWYGSCAQGQLRNRGCYLLSSH